MEIPRFKPNVTVAISAMGLVALASIIGGVYIAGQGFDGGIVAAAFTPAGLAVTGISTIGSNLTD